MKAQHITETLPAEILVVEDNAQLGAFIRSTLENEGYMVTLVNTGEGAFARLRCESFDLVLLDLMLGEINGMEVLRVIRRQDQMLPVIIVSNCEEMTTKVNGFEVGCDDYLTKPFYSEELLVRVKRQLTRRSAVRTSRTGENGAPAEAAQAGGAIAETLEFWPFSLNLRQNRLYREGEPVEIRRKLFNILLVLVQHAGETVTREQLLRECWQEGASASLNSLYVHIRQLRNLIEEDANHPRRIKTVRGVGFLFESSGSQAAG